MGLKYFFCSGKKKLSRSSRNQNSGTEVRENEANSNNGTRSTDGSSGSRTERFRGTDGSSGSRTERSRGTDGSSGSRTERSNPSTNSILKHHYYQLHKAAIEENWNDTVKVFSKCNRDEHAEKARKCALHFAMTSGKANDYLKHLLGEIHKLELEELSIAARVGNVEIVKLLVKIDKDLPYYQWTTVKQWPLNVAAIYGNKEVVSYLLNQTAYPQGSEDPCRSEFAQLLMENLINSTFYGAAVEVVKRYYSNRRLTRSRQMGSLLTLLADQPYAFRSTCSLTPYQRLLYFCISETLKDHIRNFQIYIQNHTQRVCPTFLLVSNLWNPNIQALVSNLWNPNIQAFLSIPENIRSSVSYRWCQSVTKILSALEPALNKIDNLVCWLVKEVEEIKAMHDQATELVKSLCQLLKDENGNEFEAIFKKPFLSAAENGIMEMLQQILDVCPSAIDFADGEDNMLVLAVKNRNEDILCLYWDELKHRAESFTDRDDNNILHIAGRCASKEQLSYISNPDLQLLSESEWFNKMRELVPKRLQVMRNRNFETPIMTFYEQHEELLDKGEKWMKYISKPIGNVSLLIAISVFLSVNILYYQDIVSEDGFILVAMADFISVIFSLIAFSIFTAILIFSSAYSNFHKTLRLSLKFGLGALCFSVIFMIIAFVATLDIII